MTVRRSVLTIARNRRRNDQFFVNNRHGQQWRARECGDVHALCKFAICFEISTRCSILESRFISTQCDRADQSCAGKLLDVNARRSRPDWNDDHEIENVSTIVRIRQALKGQKQL